MLKLIHYMRIVWTLIIIEKRVNFQKVQTIDVLVAFEVSPFCKIITWDIEAMKTGINVASIICIHLVSRVFKPFLLVMTLTNRCNILCSLFSFANWFFFPPHYKYHYCNHLSNVPDIDIANVTTTIIIIIPNGVLVLLSIIYFIYLF